MLHTLRQLARRLLIATLIVTGAVCGVAAVGFHWLIAFADRLLIGFALRQDGLTRNVLVIAIPTVTAAILAFIVERFAPITPGANLARVRRAYAQEPEVLDRRSVLFTFFLTPLSLGSGVPLGPETPTVIVTSGLSMWIARALGLPKKVVRGMIPVGTAAGIAAIFRTPITGVVFAVEEILGTTSRGVLGGTIVAAVAAAVVQHLLLGTERLLPASAAAWNHVSELIGFGCIGILSGILGAGVIHAIKNLRPLLQRWIPSYPARATLGGASVGVMGLFVPQLLGVGYNTTSFLLRGGGSLRYSGAAFGAKTAGFVAAMSAGLLGGTFAPSLFIGASLGSTVGHLARMLTGMSIDPATYALVGMGAFFAAFLRCPMAAVLIVLELTNDYDLIVPVMMAVAISTTISTKLARLTLTEEQMIREGYRERRHIADPLGTLAAGDVMARNVTALRPEMTVRDIVDALGEQRHQQYPVVNAAGDLLGVLPARAIARNLRAENERMTAGEMMEAPRVVARANEILHDVIARMAVEKVDRCPVVAGDGTNVVVGFLSPADLVRARIAQQADSEREDISLI